MVLTFFIVVFIMMMNFVWRYIDELVGKGLDINVIMELLYYAVVNTIPTGLPLAVLFAAIMTMGNLGENYELLAMKSAGMSLPRILAPLIFLTLIISVGSFFVASNYVPYANRQMYAILFDIDQKRQQIEFQDGVFFNGIPDRTIRVEHQNPETGLLTDVLIFDTSDNAGNMMTTMADSGYIRLSDDKRYLLITLYNGETYETTRSYRWNSENKLSHHTYSEQNSQVAVDGFSFERTDASLFSRAETKDFVQLGIEIDSIERETQINAKAYEPLLRNYLLQRDRSIMGIMDSIKVNYSYKRRVDIQDSIPLGDPYKMERLLTDARQIAQNSRSVVSFDEDMTKSSLDELYRDQVEWNRKLALPVSIIIFFLIGAPLGAIIRRGGLGMPVVVSVIFFVIYYIISISGEKMTKEGSWDASLGMWISAIILAPIAMYLTYKATNDSNILNTDWYLIQWDKLKTRLKRKKNGTKAK